METRKSFLYFSFAVVFMLVGLAGVLIYFEKGGAASFNILGQQFSSSNIGLAVLFLASLLFVYLLREFTKKDEKEATGRQVYSSSNAGDEITWNEVIAGIDDLVLQLTAADGFRPDLVVGLCGGGLVVADIVSKRLGHIPCVSLWANRHSRKTATMFSGPALKVNKLDFEAILQENSIDRVLLVDDVIYSGATLEEALEFLTNESESVRSEVVELRSAALFSLTSASFRPDYVIYTHANNRKKMPSSDRLRA